VRSARQESDQNVIFDEAQSKKSLEDGCSSLFVDRSMFDQQLQRALLVDSSQNNKDGVQTMPLARSI
jgi:hypothetical protein